MKVSIPKSWASITIEQFPLIYDIIKDKDIEPIDGALGLVSLLRGVRYTRIDTEEKGIGVIAQELNAKKFGEQYFCHKIINSAIDHSFFKINTVFLNFSFPM